MNTALIVGAIGIAGGVGYYMFLQAKTLPMSIEEHDRLLKDEAGRKEQEETEETRRRTCNLRTLDDVREMFLWQDGSINESVEKLLKDLALSTTALDEFITLSQRQVGGCVF